MAEQETHDHDRTEQASAKRLEEARARGQVPRSRELAATAVVISGALALLLGRDFYAAHLAQLFGLGLSLPRAALFDAGVLPEALLGGLVKGLELLLPVAVATIGAAVLGTVALGGWAFSTEALVPDFSRLDPVSGIKRLLSLSGLIELLKALAKFAIVAAIAGLLLWRLGGDFLSLGTLTLATAISRASWLAGIALAGLAASLVLIAAVDVPFQFWHHRRQLRMTKQEARDELKETEGRPEVRSRIRNLQRSIATRRMMADVPKADVVAMNPSHYAVALKYDDTMRAPTLIAKGVDLTAARIRGIAEANRVPILEAPPLARALYTHTDLGEQIPEKLYTAVAEVLAYVYQLKNYGSHGLKPLGDVEVPTELDPLAVAK